MSEYIKREDAYKAIHEQYLQLLDVGLHQVLNAIPDAWIPLQVKLPTDGQQVICYSKIYGVNGAIVRHGRYGLLFLDTNEEYFEFSHVTHWMEMPAPPKGV